MSKKARKKRSKPLKVTKEKATVAIPSKPELGDLDEQTIRILAILGVEDEEEAEANDENMESFRIYLKQNLELPCLVTGIEDFRWEEFYVIGPGDPNEYEKLKKTRPSYTDKFEIMNFEDDYDDEGLLVNVQRVSDKKKFTLPLSELEAVDKKSRNAELLDDYSVWFVNYR